MKALRASSRPPTARWRFRHRLLGTLLFLGGLFAIGLAVYYVESGNWGNRELYRTLPAAALLTIGCLVAQFIHAYTLLAKADLSEGERSLAVTRMFLWGQFGLLWIVFRLTVARRPGENEEAET